MPIEIIPGAKAVETIKENPFSIWPSRGAEYNRVEPIARPHFSPSFQISRGEKIFTIGSCFARNVENALLERGFELPARDVLKTDKEFAAIGPNVLNNFGVPSIFNEISWAFDTREFRPEQNFFEINPDKFIDIHLNQAIRPADYEVVVTRRKAIKAAYSQINSCRIIIMTLGLTECWFDTETKLYLNTSPRRSLIRRFPDRFELHVLDYRETASFLNEILETIKHFGHPDVRVVLTVSPVPLMGTHRQNDVMVANMYSKSVLRVAAEEMLARFAFVDYFPSFESVLLSDRGAVWEDDFVHVRKPAIELNVSRMVAGYIAQAQSSAEPVADLLERLSLETRPQVVFGELEIRQDALRESPALALVFVDAAIKLRKLDEARSVFDQIPADFDPSKSKWLKAQLFFIENRHDEVVTLLTGLISFRRRYQYWYMLIGSLFESGKLEAGMAAVEEWARIKPASGEPYRLGAVNLAKGGHRSAHGMFRKARSLATDNETTRIELDYAEYLLSLDQIGGAKSIVRELMPENPLQAQRINELKVQLGIS